MLVKIHAGDISGSTVEDFVKSRARRVIKKLGQHEETEHAIFSQSSIWRKDLGVHVRCVFEQKRR
jgi:hypothetical protein